METLIKKSSLKLSSTINARHSETTSFPLGLGGGGNTRHIKVLFIIDFFFGLQCGGTENQVWKIINHLDRAKYNVYLLSLRSSEWLKEYGKELKCPVDTFNIVKLKNPCNIITFFRIAQRIREIKPDITITFFPLSNILGVIAARISGVNIIISTRRDYGLWLNWLFKGDIYFLKMANKFINGVIVNASCIKALTHAIECVDYSKLHVIYNGIDIEKFMAVKKQSHGIKKSLGIPIKSDVIGIVANLSPMKRHETFLQAAKSVLKERPDAHFVLVGDGPSRSLLENVADSLGIKGHVHFVGSHSYVIPFLGTFTIGINCSANEGLSNAVMEYMASGVPCIVSNAGGNPELIQDGVNGYVFELDNSAQLGSRILSLLNDAEKQKEFAKKSREIISERFTLERMITDYDNYFTQLLQKNHEPR